MRAGLMLAVHADPAEQIDVARRAEAQGFDFLACGEHVFFHTTVTNAFVTLAAAAGATSRIRLLSALTILPMYPAALAAKMVANLDRVSNGRFELGVGVGGEYPPEFEACGVPMRERGPRTDEALDLFERLFTGEPVDFAGRFTTIDGLRLDPLPVQRPGPPVWVGGRSEAAMRRAGRYADVWLPYMYTPERLAGSLTRVRENAAGFGREDVVRGAIFSWSCVDSDTAWARRTAVETVNGIYGQDFEPLADRYIPTGKPQQVIDRLGEYAQAGAESVVFSPACAPEDQERVIETFAAEVLPALRDL
jgi:probable F420-dependent oxidoreductase